MLDTSGVAIPVVPERSIAYHTAGHNAQTISIGIAHISRPMAQRRGNSFVPYTPAQIQRLNRLVIDIARRYKIHPDSIVAKSQLDRSKFSDATELLPSLRKNVGALADSGTSLQR
jgi:N-acetyl-anhydromuramyl-L-alanine amidase AmpD